jgi:hypothetical protein
VETIRHARIVATHTHAQPARSASASRSLAKPSAWLRGDLAALVDDDPREQRSSAMSIARS